jgi:5-methylcytosine-specific restriction enzyme subunit McrC
MSTVRIIRLEEHHTSDIQLPKDFDVVGLRGYLTEVWQSRRLLTVAGPGEDDVNMSEHRSQLLEILPGGWVRARNYVGVVEWDGVRIEVYPKLFAHDAPESGRWFAHVLWWLGYCRRLRFPFAGMISELAAVNRFPEALIAQFARLAYHLVTTQPYSQYQETEEALTYPRGRLHVAGSVRESLRHGQYHRLVYAHEPFAHDNRLNRLIRYVARQLHGQCRFAETAELLRQVLFVLDEVSDLTATAADCDAVRLTPHFADYGPCVAMCRFFLAHSYLDLDTWSGKANSCLLVPMEYVFEDFLRGFLETHLGQEYAVAYQSTGWLTDEGVFQLRPDLVLTCRSTDKQVIVDAKYKKRYGQEQAQKKGIGQADLYQLVSYALRRACPQAVLLYPAADGKVPPKSQRFTVSSKLMPTDKIELWAASVPVSGDVTAEEQLIPLLTESLRDLLEKVLGADSSSR